MARSDMTEMGGPNRAFVTTCWTQIQQLHADDQEGRRKLLGDLLDRYWKPVYCYLRRAGHDDATAKDLTQGFFEETVLRRGLLDKADPAKGRFRAYLLRALKNYLRSVGRKQGAAKRGSGHPQLSLEGIDGESIPVPAADVPPEDAFNLAWVSEVLDRVLAEVEAECVRDGLDVHWQLFRQRVLRPITEGGKPTPVADLQKEYGIDSAGAVSNMIVTVKRRFQSALRRVLRDYATGEGDPESEIRDVAEFLSKGGAGA